MNTLLQWKKRENSCLKDHPKVVGEEKRIVTLHRDLPIVGGYSAPFVKSFESKRTFCTPLS